MAEIYAKHGGKTDEPHRHAFYTMLVIEKAKGEHNIDFKTYPLKGHEVFFISPGQVHQVIEKEASNFSAFYKKQMEEQWSPLL